ncbi:MAG: hypothetical protein RJA49_2422 [Actinomycetota bacterium]|jgi:hypothetical protein
MAATDYIAVAALKASRGITDYGDDGLIAQAITDASRAIDAITGRRFYLDAAATARTYEGSDTATLLADDIGSTTGLVVTDGGVTLALNTDYWLLPENGIGTSGETVGYHALRRASGGTWVCNGTRSVSVTARWGWPTVPTAVVRATSVLAADLLAGDRTRFGVLSVGDVVLRARANPQVVDMLATVVRADTRWGIA